MVDFAAKLKEKHMARDREKRKRREEEEEEVDAGDIGKELQDLESAWSEAEVQEGYGEIPDDTYQAKITKAYLNKSKSSGRLQLSVEFTIVSGKFKNRKKYNHMGIVDAQSLGYVKTLFARLKIDPPKKLAELNDEETLEKLVGQTCEITVKTKGDFQNTYVNKPIDLDDSDTDDADDWEPSKRSKKRDEDEEDEKPKKKSRDEDDADDDAGDEDDDKKSKRRDDDDDDDDDGDEKPKKSRRDEDDDDDGDEDEKPSKKSKRDEDEDDEDEKPSKKSRRDDDDEDEERPRKKSKF